MFKKLCWLMLVVMTVMPLMGFVVASTVKFENYSDIIFYFNCDTKGNAQKAIGSNVITWGSEADINTTIKQIGSGAAQSNNSASSGTTISGTSNINVENGRIGFWYYAKSTLDAGHIINIDSNVIRLENRYGDTSWQLIYKGSARSTITHGTSTDTWYYVELKFDGTTLTCYVNGVSKGTATASTTSSNNTITLFYNDGGTVHNYIIDNLVISNNFERDLYDIRYNTAY